MNKRKACRSYGNRHWWDEYSEGLDIEFRQSMEEGKDVAAYKTLIDEIRALPRGEYKEAFSDVLFRMLEDAPQRADYPYVEPDEWDEIEALMQIDPNTELVMPDRKTLEEKIRGAWVGRVCGCLLGKPIEGYKKERIRKLLEATDNYPMRDYIRKSAFTEVIGQDLNFPYNTMSSLIEAVNGYCPADDDINYMVIGIDIIQRYGLDFTSSDVKTVWLKSQTKDAYCTAERVAYINFVNGIDPHDSALYKNPFREWIGAQIRGDYFAYINPCDPKTAANMAWRDARISHVKNGIYGEMFVAAMIAASASAKELSIPELIRVGLSYVPSTSRLYEEIAQMLADAEAGVDYDGAMAKINAKYDDHDKHDWCHTVANARIVCAALLYGNGDYTDSICKAVQVGFDTDCNGATVGSILGMRGGIGSIDPKWYERVNLGFKTMIFGKERYTFDQAVELTLSHIDRKEQK